MTFRIERFETVESTMDAAHARAREGAAEGLWILAQNQTKGRGRRGRSWLSEAGALTTTILLRPVKRRAGVGPGEVATLSFIMALALRDAIKAVGCEGEIRLKWPNDVLVDGAKIAGILLESEGSGDGAHLAIGVGVNLASAPTAADLESDAAPPTALADHGGDASAEALLAALSAAFEIRYEEWLQTGFAGQRAAWLEAAAGFGGPIRARLGVRTIEGRFADVDAEGVLVIDTPTGRERVLAADVFLPSTS